MHFATSCRIYSTLLFVNMEPVCCGLLQSAMHLFIMVNGPGPSYTIPAQNVLYKATTVTMLFTVPTYHYGSKGEVGESCILLIVM